MSDGLDAVSDELYDLAPEDFVAARNAAEKKAKADGNRDLAGQIHQLTKPTTVAWLANQLVRQHGDEIEPLLELGAGLREATANLSGDQLRELSKQQHLVINALIGQARAISKAAGHELTEATSRGLEETLRAALADGDLADQLSGGRLSGPLEHVGFSGFGGLGGGSAPSPPAAKPAPAQKLASKEKTAEQRRAEERRAAESDLAEATEAAEKSSRDLDEAQQNSDAAAGVTAELSSKMQQLKEELDQASRDHQKAEREERKAVEVLERAERVAQRFDKALQEAQARVDKLSDS